ncbi:MAG: diguanylate cyclase [Alphaproteobacteria bacterium]|nr:diguanylate cyclase [Alphaproteobacteria bacterium]
MTRPVNPADPIQLADRVWWVGHYLDGDPFQCHVYLIENGDRSVLIDPGSPLTFPHTLKKIERIVPFAHIRTFICHHPDPDIVAALPAIDGMITRDDAVVVTHWRGEALMRHYGLERLRFWLIDAHDWHLDIGGRDLRFVFTPYAHFPGAFCTFDPTSGTLFSSDLFGGFTKNFSLFAKDESYFEDMRPFHEHYMPSRDILSNALLKMEQLPIERIAPQHGSVIEGPLVDFVIRKLQTLDCGLYLLARGNTDIQRLSLLNRVLHQITQTMVIYREFRDVATALASIARSLLPVEALEFHAVVGDKQVLYLAPENRYRGTLEEPTGRIAEVLGLDRLSWLEQRGAWFQRTTTLVTVEGKTTEWPALIIPLFSPDQGHVKAIAVLRLFETLPEDSVVDEIVDQICVPLQVAVERETILRSLDMERERFYERSVRDTLTGMYTRIYMQDTMQRLFGLQDRDGVAAVGVLMLDIDHFKSVNDTYGHNQGDIVLKTVAATVMKVVRDGDIPVRLGGEEFAVFTMGRTAEGISILAKRLGTAIRALTFEGPLSERRITVSGGIAVRHAGESLTDFLERADVALYAAKNDGRDRVHIAQE